MFSQLISVFHFLYGMKHIALIVGLAVLSYNYAHKAIAYIGERIQIKKTENLIRQSKDQNQIELDFLSDIELESLYESSKEKKNTLTNLLEEQK